jgi:hypothetical protein
MAAPVISFVEQLVLEEIRHHVKRSEGRILSTSACVDKVLKVYPSCWLPRRAIEDMVIAQAVQARLAVEMDEAAPRSGSVEGCTLRQ